MEIDITKEVKGMKDREKKMKEIDKLNKRETSRFKCLLRKTPVNNPAPRIPQELMQQHALEASEIVNEMRNPAIRILSLPAGKKQDVLHQKLYESVYIKRYVDSKLDKRLYSINDDLKFAAIYGIHLLDTIFSKA